MAWQEPEQGDGEDINLNEAMGKTTTWTRRWGRQEPEQGDEGRQQPEQGDGEDNNLNNVIGKTTTWTRWWGRQQPEQGDEEDNNLNEAMGGDNNLNKAMGKTQTMKSTELPTSILVRAISCDVILPLDDVSARHAAACLSFTVVIIVVVITTSITNMGIPAPYMKASR